MANEKPQHGTFCWNELLTRDVPGAEKFYSELLGWEPVDFGNPEMKYTMFKNGDKHSGGLMQMPPNVPEQVPPHWMAYIAVDDVDKSAEKAKELGAQVIHGPEDIPTVGRFCIIQDPTGAAIALITMA